MRILYDNTIFALQRYGGVSRYFNEIIDHMQKRNDIEARVFKRVNWKFTKFNDLIMDAILRSNRYEIYHPTYYCSAVKKRKGIKTFVTVYDMIHEIYSARFPELDDGIEIKRSSILNAEHIICISNATKKDLKEIYKIEDRRISVIYLGISLNNAGKDFNKLPKPYLLYVGRRSSYKNFNALLEAFHALDLKKDFDLICFGGGMFSEEELTKFKKLGLEDSIKYAEGVDEELSAYYKNAHIFICPSIYEGFGLPVLEAMGNDCMVIASNGGSIPEIAGDAAMFFSPDKIDELCSCLKQVINNDRLRQEYIDRGRKRVKLFSWARTTQETYDIYKKVLDDK